MKPIYVLLALCILFSPARSQEKTSKMPKNQVFLVTRYNSFTTEIGDYIDNGFGYGLGYEKMLGQKFAAIGHVTYNSFPKYEDESEGSKIAVDFSDISINVGVKFYFLGTQDEIEPFIGIMAGYLFVISDFSLSSNDEVFESESKVESYQGINPIIGCNYDLSDKFVITASAGYLFTWTNIEYNQFGTTQTVSQFNDYNYISFQLSAGIKF